MDDSVDKTLDDRVAAWEDRMKEKQAKQDAADAAAAERERQAYLRRTGRTEMEP